MGYYTDFEISSTTRVETTEKFNEIFERETDYCLNDGRLYDAKWYKYEECMTRISQMYPDELFIVNGSGEEQGDVWKHYFKNGKSKRIKQELTWPKFNEDDLK